MAWFLCTLRKDLTVSWTSSLQRVWQLLQHPFQQFAIIKGGTFSGIIAINEKMK
jgi:hypothetical protein